VGDEGIFDILTVANLFQKLQDDCRRVVSDPADRWAAIDFILTVDSLRHWAIKDSSCGAQSHSVEVQICRELANRAKHWQAKCPPEPQVRDSAAFGTAFQPNAFSPGFQRGNLVVMLDGEAEKQFGPEINIEVLASKTVEFWQREFGLKHRRA
jgi:hypothetical protein